MILYVPKYLTFLLFAETEEVSPPIEINKAINSAIIEIFFFMFVSFGCFYKFPLEVYICYGQLQVSDVISDFCF